MSDSRQAVHTLRNAMNSMRLAVALLSESPPEEAVELLDLIEQQATVTESALDTLTVVCEASPAP